LDSHCTYIPYTQTGFFSQLVTDYLAHSSSLQPFYTYCPDEAGIQQAIAARADYPVNRRVLVQTLQAQCSHLTCCAAVTDNIASLANENTFTVCTAHQPNLLTGYLYFIYKIAHAIQLANHLNEQHPGKHFVPVYYMGSEDNDLDELGTFRYGGKKYTWDGNGQQGAVGRMNTKSLEALLNELFKVMGPPGEHTEQLKELLTQAYLQHDTIGEATRYLVNELFGKYGLVVLDPDDVAFKKEILHIMRDDLLNHTANGIVTTQAELLAEQYKSQAYPRDINLFYLKDNLRERIEKNGSKWIVLNTDISWTESELLAELETHPERFSPNVILRGILQESILPDVAFIGGGAEVAYWLQLKELFNHYKVFYPVILLRQSVLWIEPKASALQQKLGITTEELFQPYEQLAKAHVSDNSQHSLSTADEQNSFEAVIRQLKDKAVLLDPTLGPSAEAALAKIKHQLAVLEQKMLRAEKRKHNTELQRIAKLKTMLFPNNSLQERVENFIEYFPLCGHDFIDTIVNNISPMRNEFLVIHPKHRV
jgi:bacillithiol biosynthesis cysteine-adding enzyme BshC